MSALNSKIAKIFPVFGLTASHLRIGQIGDAITTPNDHEERVASSAFDPMFTQITERIPELSFQAGVEEAIPENDVNGAEQNKNSPKRKKRKNPTRAVFDDLSRPWWDCHNNLLAKQIQHEYTVQ